MKPILYISTFITVFTTSYSRVVMTKQIRSVIGTSLYSRLIEVENMDDAVSMCELVVNLLSYAYPEICIFKIRIFLNCNFCRLSIAFKK